MRSLRCTVGRHAWRVRRNPEKGGAQALYEVCARCGRDRPVFEQGDGSGLAVLGLGGTAGPGAGPA
ncbi:MULTISPECIES: hypothetical protein [unclassified Cellulomonas]|jgi:hypothetical protein|uniref:hypothetical protein n=1 Tax=unclassified Cellulomonas TaxID=2620175 RepID=UPI0011C878A4|nr:MULTISPECIES: hypothetical protein [unclassified Cellulomonas]MBW0254998.1 hypothetical protein [Cellulomonas sp. PS-H5]